MPPDFCLVSCEHGGNRIPEPYRALFTGADDLLASHRGYDIGALSLARMLAEALEAPLYVSEVTRLLVDANRSLHNRSLFSEFTRDLPSSARGSILDGCYHPYRRAVEEGVAAAIATGGRVVHFSVHSFTPVFAGQERSTDIGLLYDPRRRGELALCRAWQRQLQTEGAELRVRRNDPYRGTSDSVAAALRRRHDGDSYLGIEIEINQRYPQGDTGRWQRIQELLVATCPMVSCGR